MPPVIVEDILALPAMLRARRLLRTAGAASRRAGAWAGSIRHPNALLASVIVLPVMVFGFSFGDRMAGPRSVLATDLAGLSVRAGFGVDRITISGVRDTREGDVLDYLAVSEETSLVGFDLAAARERVLALPWVRDAAVRRALPDTLVVDIVEHQPFARMLNGGRVHLVTVDGEEITDEISGPHQGLPLVVGEGAPQEAGAIFAALAARPYVLGSVVALERVGQRRWTLHMTDEVQVHLPEAGLEAALVRLETMMRQHAILERAVAAIDLRRPEQLVVRLTPDGLEALGAVQTSGGA